MVIYSGLMVINGYIIIPVFHSTPSKDGPVDFPPEKKPSLAFDEASAQDVTLPFPCSGGRGLREAGGSEHVGSPYIRLTFWGSSIYHTLV